MHTSALLFALVMSAPAVKATPTWLTDYGEAQRLGVKEGRPLAVFMAPGKEGWRKLAREGKLGSDALKQLAEGYVCVHLDTETEYGKKWMNAFNMPSGLGVVLSDRSGNIQAYRNEGSLDESDLTRTLERHSGKTVIRTSNYPETSDAPRVIYERYPIQGRIEYGSSSRGTRSSCPT
jgi:hypothetical protein